MHILSHMLLEWHVIAMMSSICVLLLVSAFVSGSETSLFSLTPTDLDKLGEQQTPASRAIISLLDDSEYTLATILTINNLVNICITILSANLISQLFVFNSGVWEFLFTTVAVTFLILLFGEILPKVIATNNRVGFARGCSLILSAVSKVLRPVSAVLVRSSSGIKKLAAKNKDNLSLDQLSNAIDITETENEEEKQMLSEIVNFASTEVEQIMKSRVDITALDIEDDFAQVRRTVMESGFSRIPVYEQSVDNIKGVLYVKDLLPYINEKDDFKWQSLMRKPYFVPEHKKINDLLEEFQSQKVHLAIVVDEYGSTQGLVSLEDILEEIVGEISDESDIDTSFYTCLGDGEFIFEGKTHLGDLEKVTGLEEGTFDDVKGEAETVAGLMLELRRNFVKKGESVTAHSVKFTAEELDGRRIDKIKVVLNAPKQ